MKTKNHTPSGKKLLVICIIILLAALGVIYAILWFNQSNEHNPVDKLDEAQKTGINFDAPTDQEKTETEQHKDDIANAPVPSQDDPANGKRIVTPTISYIDKTSAGSYVTGIFEEGGTCTIKITNGSQTFTKTSTGFGNASYTQCAPFDLTSFNLSGTYTVGVSYSSQTAQGTSETQEVTL